MKKTIKYITLLILMLIPFNVFAISYTLGTPKDGKGTKLIDLSVTDVGALNQTEAITCTTDDPSLATCEIELQPGETELKLENNVISSTATLPETKPIGRLKVTNKQYEVATTSVHFKVNGTTVKTIDNVSLPAGERPPSTDATLHKLEINVGNMDPEFKADLQEYTIYGINDTINKIKFTWECDNCKVKAEGGTQTNGGTVYLSNGQNDIKLTVTSEDGNNTMVYKFTTFRGSTSYNSLKLKSLSVEGFDITPKFDKDVKEYEVKVPKKVESIESLLKYETEDTEAKVKVEGAKNLTEDENIVTITITNRNNETAEIKLKVIREDTTPAVIEIIGYKDDKVSFMNPDGVREELSKEEFKTQYPEEWAKIENNTYQFDEDGNIIKAKEEETKKEGTSTEKKNKFPWIIVILIVVSIIIIGVAGFLIFREPKKKEEKVEEKKEEVTPAPTVEPIAPTEEIQAELNRIDTYDEEARLEAENAPVTEAPITEENIVKEEIIDDYVDESKTPTTDIDEALSDLMNTKEYNFKDKE